ncbi:hypothetical protein GWI33_016611 [Rhynchophorus ferrugineus]|uniref:Uncharacterized protein n=1 Tax=Rhynchophorus ferrugineus TaxID=354439 RepID=A0A834M355_RHYFE|nr:hypothetical protein GWI33_016611 [Rhynchophorus ferrugineus]
MFPILQLIVTKKREGARPDPIATRSGYRARLRPKPVPDEFPFREKKTNRNEPAPAPSPSPEPPHARQIEKNLTHRRNKPNISFLVYYFPRGGGGRRSDAGGGRARGISGDGRHEECSSYCFISLNFELDLILFRRITRGRVCRWYPAGKPHQYTSFINYVQSSVPGPVTIRRHRPPNDGIPVCSAAEIEKSSRAYWLIAARATRSSGNFLSRAILDAFISFMAQYCRGMLWRMNPEGGASGKE